MGWGQRQSSTALTPLETEALEFLAAHVKRHGIPPSFEEISTAFGFNSKGRVHRVLSRLERKGFIRRMRAKARALELIHSEHHHAAECDCEPCANRRYLDSLKLVRAVKHDPPAHLRFCKTSNIKPLSAGDRAQLLGIAAPTGASTVKRAGAAIPKGAR